MLKAVLMAVVVVVAAVLTQTQANKGCIHAPGAPIADTFLTGHKFNVVAHSRCETCDQKDPSESYGSKAKDMMSSVCWKISGQMEKKDFHCEVECKYNKVEEQVCTKVSAESGVELHGSLTILKTDNSTYFSAAICRLGHENFWFIGSTKPKLAKASKAAAIENLKEHHYNTEEAPHHPIKFVHFEVKHGDC